MVEPLGDVDERLDNIAHNLDAVPSRIILPLPAHDEPVQLVCFGPSLQKTWEVLDRTKTIVSVSGAHNFLMARDIVPHMHVEFDWRPHKAMHVTTPCATKFYLASCVHPKLVEKVSKPILWHPMQTPKENAVIREKERGAYFVPGGSSGGLRAIELLFAMGFRTFDIHGMDSSFDGGEWAGPHYGTSREKRDVIDVIAGGRKFKTSVAFMIYASQFRSCRKAHPNVVFNLHGDGLIQTMNKMEKAA